jgi:hypothetical protein
MKRREFTLERSNIFTTNERRPTNNVSNRLVDLIAKALILAIEIQKLNHQPFLNLRAGMPA